MELKTAEDFEKAAKKASRRKIKVEFTQKQFECFEVMINAAQGDVDNGCGWSKEFTPQIRQLWNKMLKGKLAAH